MSGVFDLGNTNIALALDCPFPASVNAGPGIGLVKAGGTWSLSLNYPPLAEEVTPVPGNLFGAYYDQALGVYTKIRTDNLIAQATGLDTRQPIVDSNYIATVHDRYVALTMALTAPRLLSLPAASSVPGGREIMVEDEVGGLSSVNYFTVQPTGADTINGAGSYVMATPYGGARFRSDGTSRWSVINTSNFYLVPAGATTYTASPDGNVIAWPAFTAPVVTTLPAASAYQRGRRITVADRNGSCTPTNTMQVKPAGTDTINGSAAPAIATMTAAYSTITLFSDGVSAWTVVGGGNITAGTTIVSTQISDSSALGRQLLTNAAAPADRTALGSGTVGDAVFVSATQATAQSAMGLGTMATQAASGVSITGGAISNVAISGGTDVNTTITTPTISGGTIDNTVIGATTPAAATVKSMNGGQLAGQRNRIINGEIRVDQRNSGAAQAAIGGVYTVDRWQHTATVVGKFNAQQNMGSVTPPPGFAYYHGVTVASAYAVTASDTFVMGQAIEGNNMADFAWGTAGALPVTLSFWARSSITGTHSGAITLDTGPRGYPFTFSLPTANTWTYVSVTIPGDTTGAWPTGSGYAAKVRFNLGSGSTYSAPAGAWAAVNACGANGAVSVVATAGATFYYTGVQLEAGPVATPFERRLMATEMINCQRYYERTTVSILQSPAASYMAVSQAFKVTKRASPTSSTITPPTLSNVSSPTVVIYASTVDAWYLQFAATAAQGYVSNWVIDASAEL